MAEKVTYLYLDAHAFERNKLEIFGALSDDIDCPVQASIHDLKYDLYRQKRLLSLDAHPDGVLCPWEGQLVVSEGICHWNEQKRDYELVS
ncbi:hypothetical protein [Pontibacillus sp. ALD_SL1]|uniref:hypothetical protein n=1 Tax=Pontibacillus sp. ALD_SL1 TaxID=2777185 RepID=UPI001A95928F|nr:hypothetical protein [Pontibacillus sp. ALD_SL1]